jgi:hypothetical protein
MGSGFEAGVCAESEAAKMMVAATEHPSRRKLGT